jgi:Alternative complex III, ActD subunit/Cytochrome C oxidase, cbb3-type, subunit III
MERTNKIFGVTGLFSNSNSILHAAEKVSDEGYKKFDVNTPYPVHGMDGAMKMKRSLLGFVTLTFGFSGTAFILFFMWWTFNVDYPLVIGGKPFFPLPAFIPITFEFTVLLAAISTVFGMIAAFFNLPKNSHPLNETGYMKAVSADKFGIVIQAEDPQFNEGKIKDFLKELGAETIETVYYPEEEKFRLFEPKFIGFLVIVALVTCGTTYITLNKLMYMIPYNWMDRQDKLIPQEKSDFFADSFGMRPPVEGTVARGFLPYPYMGEAEPKDPLSNPFIPTKEILKLGQKKFLTFCSPCHGNLAEGNSRLHGQFPNGPTLHSNAVINMSDGQIYHIITNGRNVMPSYALQITRKERWAIIDYIRVLQRAENASESDIKAAKEELSNNGQ